ncbi:MAG: hypothetical protein J5562_01025 [Clostridia bacterium]|nr:hypothetical protein [Clostridia bacterium]
MKKTFKTVLAAILLIALMLSCVSVASAYQPDYDEITWSYVGSRADSWKSEYKGALKSGENEVTFDGSTYGFTPSETGYYIVSGEFWGFGVSDISIGGSVLKFHQEGGTIGVDGSVYSSEDGSRGFPVYLKKGERTFMYFFDWGTDDDYAEKEFAPSPVTIEYVGEIASVTPDSFTASTSYNSLYYSNYDHWAEIYPDGGIEITFSAGKKYIIKGVCFKLPENEGGTYKVHYDINDGRGFDFNITIKTLSEQIESVELPEGFTPSATVDYDEYCYDVLAWDTPEYVILRLKDGTEVRAEKDDDIDVFASHITVGGEEYTVSAQYELNSDGTVLWTLREGDWYEAHTYRTGFLASFEPEITVCNRRADIIDYAQAVSYTLSNAVQYLSFQPLTQVITETVKSLIYTTNQFVSYILFTLRNANVM